MVEQRLQNWQKRKWFNGQWIINSCRDRIGTAAGITHVELNPWRNFQSLACLVWTNFSGACEAWLRKFTQNLFWYKNSWIDSNENDFVALPNAGLCLLERLFILTHGTNYQVLYSFADAGQAKSEGSEATWAKIQVTKPTMWYMDKDGIVKWPVKETTEKCG